MPVLKKSKKQFQEMNFYLEKRKKTFKKIFSFIEKHFMVTETIKKSLEEAVHLSGFITHHQKVLISIGFSGTKTVSEKREK